MMPSGSSKTHFQIRKSSFKSKDNTSNSSRRTRRPPSPPWHLSSSYPTTVCAWTKSRATPPVMMTATTPIARSLVSRLLCCELQVSNHLKTITTNAPKVSRAERESAEAFLRRLIRHEPEIRVLLDAGAQMLELQNEELGRHWLSLRPQISAAVFFNESDHLTVLTQDATVEPPISSPFNRQLRQVHHLKLPRETRAAVTLGPKVTKDGCYKLGKGQSVIFFARREVDRRFRGLIPRGQESENGVRVVDILRWTMRETCWDIGHHLTTLAARSRPSPAFFGIHAVQFNWVVGLSPEINGIPSLRKRLELLRVTRSIDIRIAEEQEREVDHEVELERQGTSFRCSPKPGSTRPWTRRKKMVPISTCDHGFCSSVVRLSDYLRPVNWVLSSETGRDGTVIVISPYEANELLPIIRKSGNVQSLTACLRTTSQESPPLCGPSRTCRLLTPSSRSLRRGNGPLAPVHLRIELNLFAGQSTLLRQRRAVPTGAKHVEVDGFVAPAYLSYGRKVSIFPSARCIFFQGVDEVAKEGDGIRWDGPWSCFRCPSLEQPPQFKKTIVV
ncbi:hypothetical protein EDB87DRAFT_1823931 [Lactarius vividus]|nr:hypothetical protein EDB87DRAFT_1823931 [Lactarius vividus]